MTDTPSNKSASDLKGNASYSILVVEDNQINLEIIQLMLDSMGYCNLTTADNGRSAYEMFQREQFDLVLMDIRMPEMNGVLALKHMRSINPAIPIIAITADAMKGQREKYLEEGFNAYLSKPISIQELQETIERVLGAA